MRTTEANSLLCSRSALIHKRLAAGRLSKTTLMARRGRVRPGLSSAIASSSQDVILLHMMPAITSKLKTSGWVTLSADTCRPSHQVRTTKFL